MKQSLQLKLGQSLTMTPQLQQAIKLLQLPTIDLQNEIQQILDSNPLLEADEEFSSNTESKDSTDESSRDELTVPEHSTQNGLDENKQNTEISNESEITVEGEWENDWTASYSIASSKSNNDFDEREFYESQNLSETSLHDHLLWQLNLTQLSDTDRTIATAIIDAISEDGYLNESLEVIFNTLSQDLEIEYDEVEAVLHRIQQFDPISVGARDLRECLTLQLSTYPEDTPGMLLAKSIIDNHLNILGARDYTKLKRLTNSTEQELQDAETLIQCLNPKPGSLIATTHTEYIVPDVFVTKRNGIWRVDLNPDLAPRIRINSIYAGMIKRADKSDDNTYLKNNLQEARWFLKSLQSRNETILKVATNIVQRQRAFFEYGEEAMRPMVLRDIADTLEMHESTISRVTNQKYMHTPKGIYEFKYFFSSHVSTSDGGECSATAIRAIIKKLVSNENSIKPLSDSKIAALLNKQGIKAARRTVAKYRESMHIPPSNERKRLA